MPAMTRSHKLEALIALAVGLLLGMGTLGMVWWQRQKALSLYGAVLVANADPRKQLPIIDVTVSAGDLGTSVSKTDSSGLFILRLRKPIRKGHPIVLHFQHPLYRALDLNDFVSSRLYIARLTPLSSSAAGEDGTRVKVANVRVRYTVNALTEVNVGSAVKTFEIGNKGNVPCKARSPCSPDGKWKAATGEISIDAGEGNEFRDMRASCIAGPCPFTRIESDRLSHNNRILVVTARDWSDPATFLVEAEVFRSMMSQAEHWSYPVIFGDGLTFSLPSTAESVSIMADLDGQTIIYPLGPALFLSWATCDAGANPDKGRVYRCTAKPGFVFQ